MNLNVLLRNTVVRPGQAVKGGCRHTLQPLFSLTMSVVSLGMQRYPLRKTSFGGFPIMRIWLLSQTNSPLGCNYPNLFKYFTSIKSNIWDFGSQHPIYPNYKKVEE